MLDVLLPAWGMNIGALFVALTAFWLFFRDESGLDLGFMKEIALAVFVAAVQALVFYFVLKAIGHNNHFSRHAGTIIAGMVTALLYKVFHITSFEPMQIGALGLLNVASFFCLRLYFGG